jgi:hypothetical protein
MAGSEKLWYYHLHAQVHEDQYQVQDKLRNEEANNRGCGLNNVALSAFNTVNIIHTEDKATFV